MCLFVVQFSDDSVINPYSRFSILSCVVLSQKYTIALVFHLHTQIKVFKKIYWHRQYVYLSLNL